MDGWINGQVDGSMYGCIVGSPKSKKARPGLPSRIRVGERSWGAGRKNDREKGLSIESGEALGGAASPTPCGVGHGLPLPTSIGTTLEVKGFSGDMTLVLNGDLGIFIAARHTRFHPPSPHPLLNPLPST